MSVVNGEGAVQAFEHSEERVAARLGIAQKRLAKVRLQRLKAEEDWRLIAAEVAYRKNGLARLLDALELDALVNLDDLAVETRPAPSAGALVEGKVAKFFINRHLLGVALGDGNLVHVRVKDREKFRLGMLVPIQQEPGDSIYTLARKEPRFVGRW
jgi:hypothetical protein